MPLIKKPPLEYFINVQSIYKMFSLLLLLITTTTELIVIIQYPLLIQNEFINRKRRNVVRMYHLSTEKGDYLITKIEHEIYIYLRCICDYIKLICSVCLSHILLIFNNGTTRACDVTSHQCTMILDLLAFKY